jgi:hypothetical protein
LSGLEFMNHGTAYPPVARVRASPFLAELGR